MLPQRYGIGVLAIELLAEGRPDEEILTEIRRRMPWAKTTKACLAWYRVQMKKGRAPARRADRAADPAIAPV